MFRRPLFAMLIAAPLAAQTPFEGTVTLNITPDKGAASTLSFMVKNGKMRFDPTTGPNGPSISVILDPVAQHMTIMMNQQKMYMDREFPSAATMQAQTGTKTSTVVKTGKSEIIAGHKCDHLAMADDDGAAVDACVTTDLGTFRLPAASNPMSPQREAGWITQLGVGAFPLTVTKGGKTIEEVTAIEKKALDPELFLPPMDYTQFQMPRKP
jgi:hypothetical protein